jgi:hypothetical protein
VHAHDEPPGVRGVVLAAELTAMSSNRRFLVCGVVVGLVAGMVAGAGVVLAQGPAASAGTSTQALPVTSPPAGASGSGVAGAAIAYPYPIVGGSPGVAPDHTIVVTGTGQADMKSDGSDRTAAEKAAIADALADAKVQASAVAAGVGVSLKGVLSVSVSVSAYGMVVPLAVGVAPGQTIPEPMPPQPVSTQLSVSATVLYAIG